MKKTLGGERLGTGSKIKVDLHGWGRSTFNQSKIWRSTMGVGMGVPCYKNVGLNGTTFEIDIKTLGHTIPAIAPCFGDFKLQVDLFACPIRLYQGLLHNNAVNIGLDMSQVLLPNIEVGAESHKIGRTNTSSLLNYLNIRGCTNETRTFNAIPILAYYDIFKNYYSNKQEENAKVLGFKYVPADTEILYGFYQYGNQETENTIEIEKVDENIWEFNPEINTDNNQSLKLNFRFTKLTDVTHISIEGQNGTIETNLEYDSLKEGVSRLLYYDSRPSGWVIKHGNVLDIAIAEPSRTIGNVKGIIIQNNESSLDVVDFPLENIDEARRIILQKSGKMERISINEDLNFLPYNLNTENDNFPMHLKEMNGLFLKTYLSDKFNNWLSNENVDLINEISSVNVDSEGNFSMDALLLAKKVYNLLNRIAVSGGTYEDWQESVYGQKSISRAESPIYIGGTSAMIQFEEVVSTAASEEQALGTLGGRGRMTTRKGGKIIYKCNEPTLILGIASITPRIDYYQGNDWFATEIDSMDDFHKPELDGIGFQNLIANHVVWSESRNKSLAKQTAWLNYQTEVNEVYGYFAEPESEDEFKSLGHMVLRRDFETNSAGEITDFTTYVDPEKYNKIFANKELASQNFWIQIGFDVNVRRVMAACEIPNL